MIINPVIEELIIKRPIIQPLSPPPSPPQSLSLPPLVNGEPVLNVLDIAPGLAVEVRYINGNWQLIPTKAPPDVEGMIINDLAKEIQFATVSPNTPMTYDEKCCLINALAHRREVNLEALKSLMGLLATDKPTPLTELPPIALLTPEDQLLNELPTTEDTGLDIFDEISYSYNLERDKIVVLNSGGIHGRTWWPRDQHIEQRFSIKGGTYREVLSQDPSYFEDVVLIVCSQYNAGHDWLSGAQHDLFFNGLAHIPKLVLDYVFARNVIQIGTGVRYFGVNQYISEIDIVNNMHPITQGIPLGPYSVKPGMYSAILELNPGYIGLAELSFTGGIVRPKSALLTQIVPPGDSWPPAEPSWPPAERLPWTGTCIAVGAGGDFGFYGLYFPDELLDRMIDFLLPAGQGFTVELTQSYYDQQLATVHEIMRSYHKPYSDKAMLKQIATEEIKILDQMRLNAQVNAPQWMKGMDILEGYKTIEIDWSLI